MKRGRGRGRGRPQLSRPWHPVRQIGRVQAEVWAAIKRRYEASEAVNFTAWAVATLLAEKPEKP